MINKTNLVHLYVIEKMCIAEKYGREGNLLS
jgi:hypothetical protein